jgi:hypothetical protein
MADRCPVLVPGAVVPGLAMAAGAVFEKHFWATGQDSSWLVLMVEQRAGVSEEKKAS